MLGTRVEDAQLSAVHCENTQLAEADDRDKGLGTGVVS